MVFPSMLIPAIFYQFQVVTQRGGKGLTEKLIILSEHSGSWSAQDLQSVNGNH